MWTVIVRDPTGKLHSKTPLKVGVVRIGRGSDCDIVLKSAAVSRLHGRLLVGEGSLIYSDEKSANGSMVNGRPVVHAVDVDEHSTILVGDFHISLERDRAGAGDADKTLQFTSAQMRELTQARPPPVPPARPAPVPAAVSAPPVPPPPVAPPPPPAAPLPPAQAGNAAPPARPTGTFTSPLADLKFVIPEVPEATRRIEQPQHDKLSDSMAHLLDQQIRGIQSRRSEVEQSVRAAHQQFEQAWSEAVTAARELYGRIRSHPKVKYYVITRDEQEISAKIADGSKRGHTNLVLSRRHPETGRLQEGYVWFCVFGESEPRGFRQPTDALEEFVRRIAAKLA